MIDMTNIGFNIKIDEFTKFYIKTVNRNLNFLGTHSQNTAVICEGIAKIMAVKCPEKKLLKYGALLHDIGKLFIPAEILNAGRPLNFTEFEIIKTHPVLGFEALECFESLRDVRTFALNHHHRNGFGYPKHIIYDNETEPLLIDILTIADSFSAIMEPRVYKKHASEIEAYKIMTDAANEKNNGLNPDAMEALQYLIDNKQIRLNGFFN
jgi:putative nucleotidyltransferase with HDIG domain